LVFSKKSISTQTLSAFSKASEGGKPDGLFEKANGNIYSGMAYLLGENNRQTPYIGSLFALISSEIEDIKQFEFFCIVTHSPVS